PKPRSCSIFQYPMAPGRTTWRRPTTARSGTPLKGAARSAASIRRPARQSRSRSARARPPHGVIVGADGAAWVTDGGLTAIVRVDPASEAIKVYPLPQSDDYANLSTAAFGKGGILWFTGQNGIYGSLDPKGGKMAVYKDPEGRGPYGITATPDGTVY